MWSPSGRSWLARGAGITLTFGALSAMHTGAAQTVPAVVQFVFTSDSHFGTTRAMFQGHTNVPATTVNAALVSKINSLQAVTLPHDGGLGTDRPVGGIDFVVDGGDIATRAEVSDTGTVQRAAVSWAQFENAYIHGLSVSTRTGERAPLYIVPGNHDISNAIGFYQPMAPAIDKTALVEIYNRMMHPARPETAATLRYPAKRVLFSTNLGGVHFVFITMWPDSSVRAWMTRDLATVSPSTPVVVFAHDQPESQAKHFINPNGAHDINSTDRFENLLVDTLADGTTTTAPTVIEQRALQTFLVAHPNITAYFHGNSNWNQFYDWTGPDHLVVLHTFRVDSPMKGSVSGKDETRLSFQVATIDMTSRTMTVRECLWDPDPAHPDAPVGWGGSTTVTLSPLVVRR